MPKTNFIRFNAIKSYINDVKDRRASDAAIKELMERVDSLVIDVIEDAKNFSEENKRKTVMGPDMAAALEKHLGKRRLAWQEIAEEILRQNPTDLGGISRAINEYIQKSKPS